MKCSYVLSILYVVTFFGCGNVLGAESAEILGTCVEMSGKEEFLSSSLRMDRSGQQANEADRQEIKRLWALHGRYEEEINDLRDAVRCWQRATVSISCIVCALLGNSFCCGL
jgi:hypothetical protein